MYITLTTPNLETMAISELLLVRRIKEMTRRELKHASGILRVQTVFAEMVYEGLTGNKCNYASCSSLG